jgi:hypothetical protein
MHTNLNNRLSGSPGSFGLSVSSRWRREILTLGEGFNTQVITLWCFYIVGRGILTLGEGFNTQVITILWCFYIVGREILTLGEGFNTQVITLWCFYIVLEGACTASRRAAHILHFDPMTRFSTLVTFSPQTSQA